MASVSEPRGCWAFTSVNPSNNSLVACYCLAAVFMVAIVVVVIVMINTKVSITGCYPCCFNRA